MRFEDSPGLFGCGVGHGTHGEVKCGFCGNVFNKGADDTEDYNNEGILVADFAGLECCETCFEKIEGEIWRRRRDVMAWIAKRLLAVEDEVKADKTLLERVQKHFFDDKGHDKP